MGNSRKYIDIFHEQWFTYTPCKIRYRRKRRQYIERRQWRAAIACQLIMGYYGTSRIEQEEYPEWCDAFEEALSQKCPVCWDKLRHSIGIFGACCHMTCGSCMVRLCNQGGVQECVLCRRQAAVVLLRPQQFRCRIRCEHPVRVHNVYFHYQTVKTINFKCEQCRRVYVEQR